MNGNMDNKQRKVKCAMATSVLALAALGVGCTPVPGQINLPPDGPVDCNDLRIGSIDMHPIVYTNETFNTILDGEAFRIQWFAEFVRGFDMNYFGFTGDYIARVVILDGDVEVFSTEIDATPLNVASGAYDSIVVDAGLPAGAYTVRIMLDPYGDVEQCNDLEFALNNVKETSLTVEPEPIDDVADAPSGQSGAGGPRGTPAGR